MKNATGMLRFGRRPTGRDPGERFQMMEGDANYVVEWADAQTAVIVRPTSAKELVSWLNDPVKSKDALCAGRCTVEGKSMIVVKRADGRYDLEPAVKR